jgi:hypothetical protein
MNNKAFIDAFCLLGLSAGGAIAQDGQWTSSLSGNQANGTDGLHRTAWTSQVYGHSASQTATPTPETLAAGNYRYEQAPGKTGEYQYTWASSYEPTAVATVAQAQTATPTVRYQWPNGSQTSESLATTTVTTKTTTTTSKAGESGYRYATGSVPQQASSTSSARIVEESYTEPTTTFRRNFLRRQVWDAYSSRISVKAAFSFNIKADFTSQNPNIVGSPDGGEVTRTYNDGYVAPDNSPTPGQTWNFGYDDAVQAPAVGANNAVFMNSVDSPSDGKLRKDTDDIIPGIEVAYEEILGQINVLGGRRRWNVGVFSGFSFSRLGLRDGGATTGPVNVTQDRYESVGGGPVPIAPVTGRNASTAGSLLVDEPTPVGGLAADGAGVTGTERTTFASPATGSIINKLDGNLFGLQIGPFIEAPITDRLLLVLAGGFGVVLADLDYTFSESWQLTAPVNSRANYSRSGSKSSFDFLWGGYARLNLRYEFDDHWAAEIGFQYQHMGSEANSVNGKTATLKMGSVLGANAGVSYSF